MNDYLHDLADGNQLQYSITRETHPVSTVVFLNGSFFNHHQWDLLVSRLGRKAKDRGKKIDLLFNDYRGFSEAKPLVNSLKFTNFRDDILEILDREKINSDICLVGASLGSLIGLGLIKVKPSIITSLVAYGFAAPTRELVRHVVRIFNDVKKNLEAKQVLPLPAEGRIDTRSIMPIANALWDIFVIKYSHTSENIKAKGFTESYASFILKYMARTPLKSLDIFLDFFTNLSLVQEIEHEVLLPGSLERITAFQGEDDLVTPYSLVKDFASKKFGMKVVPVKNKGHTDYMLDGNVCDAMADAILERMS